MEAPEQRRIIEALILASPEPVTLQRLVGIVPGLSPGVAKDRINEINTEYQESDRAFEIWEVAGGFQIRTRAEFAGYVRQLRRDRPLRLSQASLETLAIVAYKQPLTRAELEDVRGVDSGGVLKGLLDRRLLRLLGHRDVPGRPLIYGTGKRFLEVFGLESLKELPSLRELEELAKEQGIDFGPDPEIEDEEPGDGDAPMETAALDEDDIPPEGAETSAERPADEDAEPGPGDDDAQAAPQ
ncbi:MAG: SMC-Scp complex subunit ScpB [Myxococcota bacterium]|nr:SMC-Scp complex subunit ScpB [Myxococcota bacterium]